VVLPIADTTTRGLLSTLAATIEATRLIASALSTEVPPNFITIMSRLPSAAQARLGKIPSAHAHPAG
jgi:hypothetical protein